MNKTVSLNNLTVTHLRVLLTVSDYLAAIFLAADLSVVVGSVIARSLFTAPVEWADDVARGLMVASAFFGASSAIARGENPGVVFFVDLLSERFKYLCSALRKSKRDSTCSISFNLYFC